MTAKLAIKERPRFMSTSASTLAIALLAAGCLGGQSVPPVLGDDDPPGFVFSSNEASRAIIWTLSSTTQEIAFSWNVTFNWSTTDYTPVYAVLVSAQGDVLLPLINHAEGDDSHLGEGDGVVYAGAAGQGVNSPAMLDDTVYTTVPQTIHMTGTGYAFLVLAWANLADGMEVVVSMLNQTRIVDVDTVPTMAFELQDFDGVHAGSPALRASIMDTLDIPGPTFGWVTYVRSATGDGTLRISTPSAVFEDSLNLPIRNNCICFDVRRFVFATPSDVEIAVEYVGSGAQTKVFGVVTTEATLLPDVWASLSVRD